LTMMATAIAISSTDRGHVFPNKFCSNQSQ
jgi:hypothetical protein